MSIATLCVFVFSFVAAVFAQNDPNVFDAPTLPGKYDVFYVGNSFLGLGENGYGEWVQNGADEIEVAPNGLVVAGCGWDEAGRCAGLYKDGKVNTDLLKQEIDAETAWGWNTGNNAISIYGSNIYIGNTGKHLLVFTGDVDDLDATWKVQRDVEISDEPVALNANKTYVAVGYKDRFELLSAETLKVVAQCEVGKDAELSEVVLSDANEVWTVVDGKIRLYTYANGKFSQKSVGEFETLGSPSALAFDAVDRSMLIVCDNGDDLQVKFYNVASLAKPKLVKTFGEKGGLFSKTVVDGKALVDGAEYPTRFYSLHGAGTDLAGNLYVSLGFNGAPIGTLTLRAFDPAGKMTWELFNLAFVDTYSFDPDSDGTRIYTRTSILEIDPDSDAKDLNWKRVATTIDQRYSEEEDSRASTPATAYVKKLQGRRLHYVIGQYGGGFNFFTFDEENGGQVARPAGKIRSEDETWAWHMDDNGDVWHGDYHKNRSIRRFKFKGWEKDENAKEANLYKPVYDMDAVDEWPWPEDFDLVRRVIYDAKTDTLYLGGYLKTDENLCWGVLGKTVRRYNNWTTNPTIAWTVSTPVNPTGVEGRPLSPRALELAGDYLFLGMVKADGDEERTYVMEAKTGKLLGAFHPGEVAAGWQDMPYSTTATKRKDGTYLIMVEEDWRGKNIVYRWDPNAK